MKRLLIVLTFILLSSNLSFADSQKMKENLEKYKAQTKESPATTKDKECALYQRQVTFLHDYDAPTIKGGSGMTPVMRQQCSNLSTSYATTSAPFSLKEWTEESVIGMGRRGYKASGSLNPSNLCFTLGNLINDLSLQETSEFLWLLFSSSYIAEDGNLYIDTAKSDRYVKWFNSYSVTPTGGSGFTGTGLNQLTLGTMTIYKARENTYFWNEFKEQVLTAAYTDVNTLRGILQAQEPVYKQSQTYQCISTDKKKSFFDK